MPLVDNPDNELVEKAWQNAAHIRLYDPPVDGKTPADGAGLPRTSVCVLRDKEGQIERGFTTHVVGWEETWPELGNAPVSPTDTGFTIGAIEQPVEKPVKVARTANLTEKHTRTRTVKR